MTEPELRELVDRFRRMQKAVTKAEALLLLAWVQHRNMGRAIDAGEIRGIVDEARRAMGCADGSD